MADQAAPPAPEAPGAPDSPDSEAKCWYCRSAPTEPGLAFQAPLYNDVRLADVQTTFDGYNIKKTWNVVKVPVPRCRRCAGAHATRGKLVAGFTIIPVLAVIVAAICSYSRLDGFIGVLVVSIIGGVVVGLLGWGLGRLAGWLVTPKDIPDESRSKNHPTVQALLAQGWKLGSKPQPGEEFKNR